MSLLSLLLGIMSVLAPLAGVDVSSKPEPALPERELVLEPQCGHELAGREEERMMAAIQYRCEMVGLRGVQVRREGAHFLVRVNSGLITRMEEYSDTLDELESVLNERTCMQLLRVHPDSEIIVRDGEVQERLIQYEKDIVAFEENHSADAVRPSVPELPFRLSHGQYMLAEQHVVSMEDGSGYFDYLVVQTPEAAAEESLLVTEQEVERASLKPARDSVDVLLTQRGGDMLSSLTRGMQHGQDRLAILLNGVVVSAPVVHAELGTQFFISGLGAEQCQSVADGLVMPLPVPVKVISRRSPE